MTLQILNGEPKFGELMLIDECFVNTVFYQQLIILGTEIWKVLLKVRGKNTTPPQPPKNDLNWSNSVSFGMKL